MTGPIKPPGAPKAPGLESPTEVQRNADTAGAFKDAVSTNAANAASESAPIDAAASAQSTSSASAAVAAELRAGTLEAAGAVERLISEALASPAAAGLSGAGKQALENHLRETLAEDPALAALVTDLER